MKEKALLAVSFGTSHEDTRQKTIGAVEQALSDAFGGWQVEAAYTSPTIRRILAGRGQAVPSPEEAMEAMAAQGVRRLLVQPTHLICGEEYDKLCKAVWQREGLFERVQMGQPLLYDLEDYKAVAQAVCEALPVEPEEALVLDGATARPTP